MRFHTAVIVASLFGANTLSAQSFTNGSFTGAIANSTVPAGWTALEGNVDIMDQNNNVGVPGLGAFAATPSPSPDGGTWVGFARSPLALEKFGQTVAGFSAGQNYTISWYVSNFGLTAGGGNFSGQNMIEVLVEGVSIGTGAMRPAAEGWTLQSLSFVATAPSQAIAFQLGSATFSYMGIDGVSISSASVVPEPGTYALMMTGLVGLGIAVRRRRINS